MEDVTRRHATLVPPPVGINSYGELATWHLRQVIAELLATVQTPTPLDVPQLHGRAVYALTRIEADDPAIPRHDIGPDMPNAGHDAGTDSAPPSN